MYIVILGVLWVYHFLVISVSTQSLKYKDVGNQTNFHFENCNRSATPFYVQHLKLYPDPINLQMGHMFLSIEFSLERDVGKDNNRIDIDLNWRLKTSEGYTELCDIIGENNCHFNDLCAELKKIMDRFQNYCPPFMKEKYHNNCSCPFLKNDYTVPTVPLRFERLPIQLRGTFDLTINLQEQGTHVGCVRIEFCITDCTPLGG